MNALDLAKRIAEATGCTESLARLAVDDLAEHGLIEGADAPADAEVAAKLLIAFGGAASTCPAHRSVERFWSLPCVNARRLHVTDTDVVVDDATGDMEMLGVLEVSGDTFGKFLTTTIETYVTAPALPVWPSVVSVGHGPGLTNAGIGFVHVLELGFFESSFTFANSPDPALPDDAPPARREVTTSFPGTVFQVIREALTGDMREPTAFVATQEIFDGLKDLEGGIV